MEEAKGGIKRSYIVIAAVAVVIVLLYLWQVGLIGPKRYVAVYLRTGDLYFGEQKGFWGAKLDNVWLFQAQQDRGLALVPLRTAAWSPSSPLRINDDQIVFWTYLSPEGQVAQAIAGRLPVVSTPAAQQIPQGQSGIQPQTPQQPAQQPPSQPAPQP